MLARLAPETCERAHSFGRPKHGDGQPSHPTVLVPHHLGEISLAGLVVNQADDECPHDPTSSFDRGGCWRFTVSARFRGDRKTVSSDGEIISVDVWPGLQQRRPSRHRGGLSKLDPAPGFGAASRAAVGGFVQRLFRWQAFQGNARHQDQAIGTRHQPNGLVDVAADLASVSEQLRQRHVVLQRNQDKSRRFVPGAAAPWNIRPPLPLGHESAGGC